MSRLTPHLRQVLDNAGPAARGDLALIVTLRQDIDWRSAVEAVQAAGLQVEREEPAIYALFGEAALDAIPALARLPEVELVEAEGRASALGADKLI